MGGLRGSTAARGLEDLDLVLRIVNDLLVPTVYEAPTDQQPRVVRALPPGLRGLWGVCMVDGQVNNGGFQQFFRNDSRYYVAEARGATP